jgi:hypothetical protein
MVTTRLQNKQNHQSCHSPSNVEEASPNSKFCRSLHPARTNRAGLPLHKQKQLLQAIEGYGGIGDDFGKPFKLNRICKRRTDLYGEPGSELRRQIQNKVHYWRCLPKVEYLELLRSFGISSQPELVKPALPTSLEEELQLSPAARKPHAKYDTTPPCSTPSTSAVRSSYQASSGIMSMKKAGNSTTYVDDNSDDGLEDYEAIFEEVGKLKCGLVCQFCVYALDYSLAANCFLILLLS